jgi:hypothetical protein
VIHSRTDARATPGTREAEWSEDSTVSFEDFESEPSLGGFEIRGAERDFDLSMTDDFAEILRDELPKAIR